MTVNPRINGRGNHDVLTLKDLELWRATNGGRCGIYIKRDMTFYVHDDSDDYLYIPEWDVADALETRDEYGSYGPISASEFNNAVKASLDQIREAVSEWFHERDLHELENASIG